MGVGICANPEPKVNGRVNSRTLLWRQVIPGFIREGRITSQLFTPSRMDDKKVSVYDGDQITAEESWRHYTTPKLEKKPCESAGVMAVTIGECYSEGILAIPDPGTFLEHVLLDFTALSNKVRIDKGKILTDIAKERGWVYCPPATYA